MAENQDYELDPLAVEQSAQLINEFGQELKRQQATAEACLLYTSDAADD